MTARVSDINGWYEIPKNPISKVGVFPYLGKNIKGENVPELDPGKVYNVLRPAEELSDPECMESFRLLPWIDGHVMLGDPDKVAPGLTPAEEKGIGGVIGERIVFEDDTLYANIKLLSSAHADVIENGTKELSCGYRCTYEYAPGIWNGQPYDFIQRKIRGNHLASVPEGRMGPDVAVMDAAVFQFAFDSKELIKMADPTNNEGGGAGNATVADLIEQFKAVAPLFAQMQELIAAAQGNAPAAVAGSTDEDPTDPTAQVAPAGAEDEDPAAATDEDEEKTAEAMDAAVARALAPLRKSLDAKGVAAMDAAIKGLGATVAKSVKRAAPTAVALDAAVAKALAPFQKQLKAAPTVADVTAGIARRDKLAGELSKHVGAFDHSAMTEAQVAAYGVQALKLQNVPKGQEVTAVSVALQALPTPGAGPTARHVAAMDAADPSQNMFLAAAAKGQ